MPVECVASPIRLLRRYGRSAARDAVSWTTVIKDELSTSEDLTLYGQMKGRLHSPQAEPL